MTSTTTYGWQSAAPKESASYLTPAVIRCLEKIGARKILDLGCGNGALCADLTASGFDVEGCEPSADGFAIATKSRAGIRFHNLGVYDEPSIGQFDAVVSTEVIEHLYSPKALPKFARKVLKPGGHLIVSTPYHGYMKDLAIAAMGRCDRHHGSLVDGGHIKFFSRRTLTTLLENEGFIVTDFMGAGRLPYLWKSMVLTARGQ